VVSPELAARVTEELQLYLDDDCQAWILASDGSYTRAGTLGQHSAQAQLLSVYDDRVAPAES
jgi:polyphosphate kinase